MYRHKFVLVSGEEIVAYSKAQDICHINYGDVFCFLGENQSVKYTIPVLSVLYVDTEEVD